jgi:mitochondrial splicing suppressor protein 51
MLPQAYHDLLSCRTERIMRMEGRKEGLMPCSNCRMAFCCSQEHWDIVRALHSEQPCPTGKHELTQCQLMVECRQDSTLHIAMNPFDVPDEELTWAPNRVKDDWESVASSTWESEFNGHIDAQFNISGNDQEPAQKEKTIAAFLRAVSDGLSIPMTILWALEKMRPDLAWSRQEKLEIHVRCHVSSYEEY